MILLPGLNVIRDLHAANMDKAWLGTDGSAVVESQTGLQAGVAATKLAILIDSSTDKTNSIQYTLPSTAGVGSTYREFAVIMDGVVEYDRTTFTGISHTANDDIVIKKSYFYRNL